MTTSKTSHPKGLYTLFVTEMWERYSYYGMRALLTLFLVAELTDNGFGMNRAEAFAIYGTFTGLVYLTPILGGYLADAFLGQRKSIYIGAFVMAAGQFTMAYSVIAEPEIRQFVLYSALSLLIIGNGFFKPNISTIVGGLYENNDPRKDGGFTIFYMGINLGAFIAPLTAGYVGETYGWQYGFALAGFGMILGAFWFFFRRFTLNNIGLPPRCDSDDSCTNLQNQDWVDILLYTIIALALSVGIVFLIENISAGALDIIIWVIGLAAVGGIGFSIASGTKGSTEWSRVFVILILAMFNIVFWSGFEQAGSTFNLFAVDQTDRMIGSFEIPATWFQSVNAIAIFAIAPIFDILWGKLTNIGKNPPTPMKFGFALFMLALGFFVMSAGAKAGESGLVSPLWLVAVYLLHTLGELMISPIGLSMITKLSPPKIISIMMGLWMGSIAMGNKLAAGMEGIAENFGFQPGAEMFSFIAFQALVAGVIAIILTPVIKKMMKGIH
ncbi:MAG: peptide MFS transporter [Ichthyobacteriaceae bacterium]|nr:peptide MFS transporter [Ichthyobacteriaceae bacterium]